MGKNREYSHRFGRRGIDTWSIFSVPGADNDYELATVRRILTDELTMHHWDATRHMDAIAQHKGKYVLARRSGVSVDALDPVLAIASVIPVLDQGSRGHLRRRNADVCLLGAPEVWALNRAGGLAVLHCVACPNPGELSFQTVNVPETPPFLVSVMARAGLEPVAGTAMIGDAVTLQHTIPQRLESPQSL